MYMHTHTHTHGSHICQAMLLDGRRYNAQHTYHGSAFPRLADRALRDGYTVPCPRGTQDAVTYLWGRG